MSPAWSSSMTTTPVARSSAGERLGPGRRHAHAGRVVGAWLEEQRRRARALERGAQPVGPHARARRGRRRSPRRRPASSRSSSGGNVGFSTTTRSPRRTHEPAIRSRASIAPSTTVSASGGNGHARAGPLERRAAPGRRGSSSSASGGRPGASDRAEVGQQGGVGRAGRQVERGSAPGRARSPGGSAAAPPRPAGVGDERAAPAPGLDRADARPAAPRLADRRRADTRARARQLAHGRQPGARGQVAGA